MGPKGNEEQNAIVEYLDYQIPCYSAKGPKGNGDMQAAQRDWNLPLVMRHLPAISIYGLWAVDRFKRYAR